MKETRTQDVISVTMAALSIALVAALHFSEKGTRDSETD